MSSARYVFTLEDQFEGEYEAKVAMVVPVGESPDRMVDHLEKFLIACEYHAQVPVRYTFQSTEQTG